MDQLLVLLEQILASPTATAILTFVLTAVAAKYPWLSSLLAFFRRVVPAPADPNKPQPAVPDIVPNSPFLNELLKQLLVKLLEKHKEANPAVAVLRELEEGPKS